MKSARRGSRASISVPGPRGSSSPSRLLEGTSSASIGGSRSMRRGGGLAMIRASRGISTRQRSSERPMHGGPPRRTSCAESETVPAISSTWATESFQRRDKRSCAPSCVSCTNRLDGREEAGVAKIDGLPTAVLLTAVGGPNSLDEVGPFLLDVRGGRPTSDALVNEFRERYRRIGGRSPLLDVSRAQAKALEDRLNRDGDAYRCYVGMRNWPPYIGQVLPEVVRDGVERLVVLPLTPYNSRRSVGAYFSAVKDVLRTLDPVPEVADIESWNTEPPPIQMFAAKVHAGLERLEERGFLDPVVVFTAHSLPKQLIDAGDPYERELSETMSLVLQRLPPLRTRMAWQSAGRTEEEWLGPPLGEVLAELGDAGEKAVLVAPFGFVSDHLEILYDVDIEAKELAAKQGVHLWRTDSPNTDPRFIDAMAAAVRSALV